MAASTRARPSGLKASATFSNGPAVAEAVGTEPAPGPVSETSGVSFRRFSAPEIRASSPASMKPSSRRSLVRGESGARPGVGTEKAEGYCTGSPREPRIATELAASPETPAISALTPQPRSSAGSLEAPIAAIGATMKGMLPCWNFWKRESGSAATKTGPPPIRNWSTW